MAAGHVRPRDGGQQSRASMQMEKLPECLRVIAGQSDFRFKSGLAAIVFHNSVKIGAGMEACKGHVGKLA